MWAVTAKDSGFQVSNGEKTFTATAKEDAEWLATALDEVTNTVVKLFCQNKGCKGFGGYITRTAADSKKTMYPCDDCGKPMTRKAVDEAEPGKAPSKDAASEKQIPRQSAAAMRAAAGNAAQAPKAVVIVEGGTAVELPALTPELEAVVNAAVERAVAERTADLTKRLGTLEEEFGSMAESFQATLSAMEALMGAQKT